MTLILAFVLRHWTWFAGAIGVAVIFVAVSSHFASDAHTRTDLAAATQSAADWKTHALGWEVNAKLSEEDRGVETAQAREAINADASACQARVDEARRSATAIHTLVSRPVAVDAHDCPVVGLMDHGQLASAIGAKQ
jgi:hypothetical protein